MVKVKLGLNGTKMGLSTWLNLHAYRRLKMISVQECAKRIMKIAGGLESAYEANHADVLEFIEDVK
jgi:hypothetical protein